MGMRVLIGGVGHRWQRDASFGVVASDSFAKRDWPQGVTVADLGYGALYAAQDIADADPPYDGLVLIAAMPRGREPGRLYSYWYHGPATSDDEVQERVREAGAGVIDLDHLLVIAGYFGVLPADVVSLELEPVDVSGGEELSPAARAVLPQALALARREALAPVREGVRA